MPVHTHLLSLTDNRVFRLLGFGLFVAGVLSGVRVDAQETATKDWLATQISISLQDSSVYGLIQRLHTEYGIPISYIDAGNGSGLTLSFTGGPLRRLLDNVVEAGERTYRYATINGRLVLYPNQPKYALTVENIHIADQPRLVAAEEYVGQLHRLDEFKDLLAPPLFGDARSPVFIDRVTLSTKASVLEHFVQLLGADRTLVFQIAPAKSGVPMLSFQQVKGSSQ